MLDLQGASPNVFLKIADLSEAMARNVPDVLMDLIEVAVYVFAADQATARGGVRDSGDAWRRRFQFHIPVRQPDLWSRSSVTEALVDVMSFLSDDDYSFAFTKLDHPPAVQLYFEQLVPEFAADEVALFSGGLDSLAGSIQEELIDGRKVALISHDSASKRKPQITELAAEIAQRAKPGAVRHIPVWATKAESVGREYTQRSRSFLYAALATTVASMLGRDRIRFYENGVTSMNLPIAPQVVGGRATRTTHPQSIRGLARLFTTLLERPFTVESPFIWKTKTDVVRIIKDNGCGALVARSVSCSRTVEATKLHTHCGRCSQCIDRRFATLAAGATDEEDPSEMYKAALAGARVTVEHSAHGDSTLIASQITGPTSRVDVTGGSARSALGFAIDGHVDPFAGRSVLGVSAGGLRNKDLLVFRRCGCGANELALRTWDSAPSGLLGVALFEQRSAVNALAQHFKTQGWIHTDVRSEVDAETGVPPNCASGLPAVVLMPALPGPPSPQKGGP
jgi:7-cyano-7-deazaguanine synthase in queuosine biosynthesis